MVDQSVPTRTAGFRRVAVSTALAASLMAGSTAALMVGTAGSASAAATDGWTRIAHLSPDTKSVDVQLTALAGGTVLYELKDVSYGVISDYLPLPAGTYVVSMVPAGTDPKGSPVISDSVTVASGEPITVAAYGTNDDLKTAVYQDDLANPAAGESRVRVIQASTIADSVDIATSTGLPIAENAQQGAATGYATVPAGQWTLNLSGDATGTAQLDLSGGTVNTLLVLDTAEQGLTVKAVVDAAAPAATPVAGVDTGGGWAARSELTGAPSAAGVGGASGVVAGLGAALALAVATLAAMVVSRRRSAGAAPGVGRR